jgi:hypothetical protein
VLPVAAEKFHFAEGNLPSTYFSQKVSAGLSAFAISEKTKVRRHCEARASRRATKQSQRLRLPRRPAMAGLLAMTGWFICSEMAGVTQKLWTPNPRGAFVAGSTNLRDVFMFLGEHPEKPETLNPLAW